MVLNTKLQNRKHKFDNIDHTIDYVCVEQRV